MLRDEGAQPVLAPTIALAPPEDERPLRDAVTHLDRYDWIVFTSANAVAAFFSALEDAGLDARAIGRARFCVIGSKTKAALDARSLRTDLLATDARAEGVLEALRPRLRARSRILLPRAEVAREVLPDSLRTAGAEVDVVPAYRNVPPGDAEVERIRSLIDPEELDAVLFTSSSTVENLCDVLGDGAAERLNALGLFSIGPVTTKTAERLGLRVSGTAELQSIESLVAATVAYYAGGDAGG